MRARILFTATLLLLSIPLYAALEMSKGIAAFEERRWSDAMEIFFDVLRQDPANATAHAYVNLAAREMAAEREGMVRQERLAMLDTASKHLDSNQKDSTPLHQAITDTTMAQKYTEEAKWRSRVEDARMQREGGHLLAANDIILQVLDENSSFSEAQLELTEIQSQIRHGLDSGDAGSVMERYALEGFYAYGQADYATALAAWDKVHTFLAQSYAGPEGQNQLEGLHFLAYERRAQAHAEEDRRAAELKALFEAGVSLFQGGHFSQALEEFRKLAIREPQYPQLGSYLVQAEAEAEKERAARLGERKRHQIDHMLQEGLADLEHENFEGAQKNFEAILKVDPGHSRASSYLAMAQAEMQKRHDPKAAQMHYEAGLVAYASGKLDDAMREWRLAVRMNAGYEKAQIALAKVQKELALNRDGGSALDEALP